MRFAESGIHDFSQFFTVDVMNFADTRGLVQVVVHPQKNSNGAVDTGSSKSSEKLVTRTYGQSQLLRELVTRKTDTRNA